MKGIDQRQQRYFTAGTGRLEFTKTGEMTAEMALASTFGTGSLWGVIAIAAAVAVAATVIVVKKKKNGGRKNDA